jgi:mRNA interferase MazF
MKKPSVICDPWDVVVVPFPFTDRNAKRRPALIVSNRTFNRNGHSVMEMITSAEHSARPGDVPLRDHAVAGLRVACVARVKLFTLDNRLILRKAGSLSPAERSNVRRNLRAALD